MPEGRLAPAGGLPERLAEACESVFGARLGAVVAYGSGVDGSFIAGFSDFDVAVFCQGEPTLRELLALHRALAQLDPVPFAYVQVKFVDLAADPRPVLIPGAIETIVGQVPNEGSYLFGESDLLGEAGRWLEVLPGLVVDDARTWSVAIGSERRRRHVRLICTRVKPAVRSRLAVAGVPPISAFLADWREMAELLGGIDEEAAGLLRELRTLLPPSDDVSATEAGEIGLRLLWRLAIDRAHGG